MGAARASIARRYTENLAGLPLDLPVDAPEGDTHAWHLYVVRVRGDAPVTRDELISRLAAAGVGTSVHFIPLHRHPYWRDQYHLSDAQFPVATAEFDRVVSLPISSGMTDSQVERVIAAVASILG
jgi:dTDP-4-amino-4,6-dideoxygalactose transaminase